MVYYIVAIAFSIVIAAMAGEKYISLRYRNRITHINYSFLFALFPLWFILAWRYNVGKDYGAYAVTYFRYGLGEGRQWEIISTVIIMLSRFLNSGHVLIVVYAFIFCFFLYAAIYKNKYDKYYSIIMVLCSGLLFESVNIMRQTAATAVFLWCISSKEGLCWKKKILPLFIASLLHKTAVLYIVWFSVFEIFYKFFGNRGKTIKKILTIMLPVSLVTLSAIRPILETLADRLHFYQKTFHSVYDNFAYSPSFLLLTLPGFLLVTLFSDDHAISDPEEKKQYWLYYMILWTAAFCAMLKPIVPNGERIIELFLPVEVLSLPALFHYCNKKIEKVLKLCVAVVSFAVTIHYYYVNNATWAFPYQFIF